MKLLILDGSKKNDVTLLRIKKFIDEEIGRNGWLSTFFALKDIEIASCTGCFDCWLKTPGLCPINDAGREILRMTIKNDVMIFLTPIICGGYSSELKKAVDRLAPLSNPFFIKRDGKTQHVPRYKKMFRFIAFGALELEDIESENIFKDLVARNAINFINSVHAAEVFLKNENDNSIKNKITDALKKVGADDGN